MRPGRNPRRGYDEEGREITPATVASTQRNGARGIIARCACNHEALLPFDGLHPVRSRLRGQFRRRQASTRCIAPAWIGWGAAIAA